MIHWEPDNSHCEYGFAHKRIGDSIFSHSWASQINDEFILVLTYDSEIDWMLTGMAPTMSFVQILMLDAVMLSDLKRYQEHIYWDHSLMLPISLHDLSGLLEAGVADCSIVA